MRSRPGFESSFDRAMNGVGEIHHDDFGSTDESDGRNGYAKAGLILSILGNPFLLGSIFSISGLVRAARVGAGKAMAWTGIVLSLVWLGVTVAYVAPVVTGKAKAAVAIADKRSDPGCKAVQVFLAGPLGSKDLSQDKDAKTFETDVQGMISALSQAAAKSSDAPAKAAITKMAADFQTLLGDVKAGKQPPDSLNTAITNDGNAIDKACGNT